jgi:diguanylate cyclase (GGDEF)-like protein
MLSRLQELPKAAWLAISGWTILAIVVSAGLALAISEAIMRSVGHHLHAPGVAIAIAVSVLVGGPAVFYHLVRQQQLRLANQRLQVLASTDWLTACLNRRAFTHQVSDHLGATGEGAFLVIDADHFKVINDHYGHDRGDEVLQLLATTIKSNLREGDLVGRIGGEEFGVFLKGANQQTAEIVAERIRRAIERTRFMPDGTEHPLSVSVGGAFYDEPISFSDLFRVADQKLYGAKQSGRNRVIVADVREPPTSVAA